LKVVKVSRLENGAQLNNSKFIFQDWKLFEMFYSFYNSKILMTVLHPIVKKGMHR
jgi:hypothetical protein